MTKTALMMMLAVTSTLELGGTGRANAATVTETYNFTASGFMPSGSPVDPWTGAFTITFDPATASFGALDAFSSNLPAGYGTFTYVHSGSLLDIGNDCFAGQCAVVAGLDTAILEASPVTASGGLTFLDAAITSASSENLPATSTGTLTPAPSTPLPATLPLFATGLGALGLLGWRRKRKSRVSLLGAA